MQKSLLFFWMTLVLAGEQKYSNALINEASPYLQQHADNPVHWYPWGEEALKKAKREDKLIFLSIGYSTCHWCHVMEEESFESEYIAALLNRNYISIKVDREELPQLDKKYQKRYLDLYSKRGGWPLSVFLTSDLEVLHLATYIPLEAGYGSKGMDEIVPSLADTYHKGGKGLEALIKQYGPIEEEYEGSVDTAKIVLHRLSAQVVEEAAKTYDTKHGGFATRPKFPEASKIELLLILYSLTGNKQARVMAETTLRRMAEGGIYDQIEGGFFRYTTDEAWQIPHFEKMLYTNAELVPLYVKLYELTGDRLYKKIVDGTITHLEHYYRKEGLYLSASDADSEGEEGGYFIYSYEEVRHTLIANGMERKEVEAVLAYLGIKEDGNIDGEFSHVHITQPDKPAKLNEAKAYLRALRQRRSFPFVDAKVITAWNAMMIKALFRASRLDRKYLNLAEERLETLLAVMGNEGGLYHQTLAGKRPMQEGLLEDYAFMIDALLEAYLCTYHKAYLEESETLLAIAVEKFYHEGTWYLADDMIKAEADFDDRYYTSPLGIMMDNLVRLASLRGDQEYTKIVEKTLRLHGSRLADSPSTVPKLTQAYLRMRLGDIVIKAPHSRLPEVMQGLESLSYPFLLAKADKEDDYLACCTSSCFAQEKERDKFVEEVKAYLKQIIRKGAPKRQGWTK
ncbi:MAG: thioredoxin domain-containing protein [Sulfurimonas sp.]